MWRLHRYSAILTEDVAWKANLDICGVGLVNFGSVSAIDFRNAHQDTHQTCTYISSNTFWRRDQSSVGREAGSVSFRFVSFLIRKQDGKQMIHSRKPFVTFFLLSSLLSFSLLRSNGQKPIPNPHSAPIGSQMKWEWLGLGWKAAGCSNLKAGSKAVRYSANIFGVFIVHGLPKWLFKLIYRALKCIGLY